jgi:hypothetical protein
MDSRRWCVAVLMAGGLLFGQRGGRSGPAFPADDVPLPRMAADAAKADREQNIKDATRLAELSEKVKADLSSSSSFTLSLTTVKNAEEMAVLARKLHSRLKSGYGRPDPAPMGYDASQAGRLKK